MTEPRPHYRLNKYNARKVTADGYTFDSQAEHRRYQDLRLMERAGQIECLEVHPRYVLQNAFEAGGKRYRAITMYPDFRYIEAGQTVIEDVKGGKATQTATFRLKLKLFMWQHRDVDFRLVER